MVRHPGNAAVGAKVIEDQVLQPPDEEHGTLWATETQDLKGLWQTYI